MKTLMYTVTAMATLLVMGEPAFGEDKYYEIDPAHSSVGFRIRHLYSSVAGRFNKFSGTISGDFDDPATLKITGHVDVNSVDTAVAGRDIHLRKPDFFNTAKFPDATFKSTGVKVNEDGDSGEVTGDLALMGITKKVTFKGRFLGHGPDHKGGQRAGFHATATIDKRDFGITYNATLPHGITVLGEKVELILDLEAIEVEKPPEHAGSLAAEIARYKGSRAKDKFPADVKEALEKAKKEILAQGNIDGLPVGAKAPGFSLADAKGKRVKLSEELKMGPVVLVFYRGEWCPFCNLQLKALGDVYPEIRKLGASLIGISPQTADPSGKSAPLPFPLLSDVSSETLREYKLLYTVPEKMQEIYRDKFGIDLEKYNGEGRWELPVTATYILDAKGIIRSRLVDVDYTRRMEPEDILKVLKDLGS
ncbi:MAG: YceI family protein [Lentisphaerae bacterium]|nr:YceI family protein [Lentisphaerota bacterium]